MKSLIFLLLLVTVSTSFVIDLPIDFVGGMTQIDLTIDFKDDTYWEKFAVGIMIALLIGIIAFASLYWAILTYRSFLTDEVDTPENAPNRVQSVSGNMQNLAQPLSMLGIDFFIELVDNIFSENTLQKLLASVEMDRANLGPL